MRPLAMVLVRRLATAVVAALGATLLVSVFLHLVPGDPVDALLGEQATLVDREAMRACVGYDDPSLDPRWTKAGVLGRAALWTASLGREVAAFGHAVFTLSLKTSIPPCLEPVFPRVGRALPRTALLGAAALLVALLLGPALGIVAAVRRGSAADAVAMAFAVGGASVPRFWLGPVLILVFAVWLDLVPVSGFGTLRHLVLPSLTLGTAFAALLSRVTRASLLDAIGEEYVVAARARGLPEWKVVLKHALRNALLPVVTVAGLELGALFGGAVITEKVFAWPGMGMLLLTSIEKRDYNTVRACVLVFTLGYVAVNLLTDLAYALIDPRVRTKP